MITTTCLATLWLLGGLEARQRSGVDARRLASVPRTPRSRASTSARPRRLGLIAKRGAKEFAVVDGVPSEEYDAISSSLTFSPDARNVAYLARNGAEQFAIVTGSAASRTTSSMPRPSAPTALRFAYAASRGARRYVVLDGRRGCDYDSLTPPFVFSADSRHLAYVAGRAGRNSRSSTAPRRIPSTSSSSPWLQRQQLAAGLRRRRRPKEVAVVDGIRGAEFERLMQPVTFSPDSRHFAYVARQGRREFAVSTG
jgi:hypothetical protein